MSRKDGTRIEKLDSMHVVFPFFCGGRTENEAVINETLDITAVEKYIEEKNSQDPEFKYTFFQVICAAIMKTFVLRPKLNRFYAADKRLYQRNNYSISFVVKKEFNDKSEEGIAIVKLDPESDVSPIEQIRTQIEKIIKSVRKEGKNDHVTGIIDKLNLAPSFVLSAFFGILKLLDRLGIYPKSLIDTDPYFTSVFITNLGSIKMNANYHHLSNWGTNSFFAVVGEKAPKLFVKPDGTTEIKDGIDFGITVDERISDGYYYSNSVRMIKKIIENPWLLDEQVKTEVEY